MSGVGAQGTASPPERCLLLGRYGEGLYDRQEGAKRKTGVGPNRSLASQISVAEH
jgi:hypothetical protein